jgi:TPR repeat protein
MPRLIFGARLTGGITSQADTVTDFRLERLRRSLKSGWTSDAFVIAEKYASSGLAEAQYILGEMLSTRGQAGDAEAAQRWYEAAANQGHAAACKALWWRDVNDADADAWERSIRFMCQSADLGDPQASMTLITLFGGKRNCDKIPNMLEYLQRHVARGSSLARYYLGYAHDMGHFGVPRNAERAFELYMLAAQQGDALAQCCVGICYARGLGVKQDDEQAVHWYSEAAKRGSAQAQHNLGYSYENGRKPLTQSMREANRWFRRAALRDFDLAQYSLGLSYLNGRELPQNAELANRWFARAAQQGCPIAQVALGYSYETGRGVAVSLPKAVELYEAAAKAGDAQGQHNYAHMLQNGFGVERNLSAASRYYLAAAEQGLAVAQDNLANMYMDGSGIQKDLTEAVKWRRKAAEQGLANAQCNLAWMYTNGVGVEKSDTEALHWYRAAAEQGHANAQCVLAWLYVNGVGVEKSPTEALRWYQAAAEQGSAVAQHNLARMYNMEGAGVEKDLTEAVRWYRKAAEQGHANAQCDLAWMYANGVGVKKSDTETLRWCRAAAEQGLANAQYNFALMYLNGIGVDKDPMKALRWCQAAAEQGLANAQHNLAWMYLNGVGVDKDPAEALRWCQAAAEKGHEIAQHELPAYLAYGDQKWELADARNALNAIEARLGSTDPAYAAKKALLVPILRPIFAQMPPSKWADAFEQAYEQTRVPPVDRTPATSRVEIRDKIFEQFDASTSSDQRSALLATLKATMDIVESHLAKNGDEQQLAEFREARADDYTKLVVKESTVDGTVEGTISPEAFMAVTNREIAASRMSPDDPIRQLAVKAAAAPHLSHAESLAQEVAMKRSDAAIQNLANELTSAKNFNVADARAKIQKAWAATTTSDQRGRVLAIFKVVMDEAEQRLVGLGDDKGELLADFQKARVQYCNLFILEECTVGLDSPGGGDVSIELLMTVTNREIAAGRMTEDHSMRKIAVEGATAPHFSHAELLAKHAKLKEAARKPKAAPAPKTVGEKLKSLFRRN